MIYYEQIIDIVTRIGATVITPPLRPAGLEKDPIKPIDTFIRQGNLYESLFIISRAVLRNPRTNMHAAWSICNKTFKVY